MKNGACAAACLVRWKGNVGENACMEMNCGVYPPLCIDMVCGVPVRRTYSSSIFGLGEIYPISCESVAISFGVVLVA